ncbi:MAG: hypothetical protein EBU04_10525, partial [Verrucomicrobia bacterium]|nr:hypothetical protein [Verrucomicrobiota bacterium]NBS05587.1 hypothetical protein [Verrucomicrobiota bacterium]
MLPRFMVTGDGHGHREFRSRHFGHRELAPGFRQLMAERLTPERLTTVAVTRHQKFRARARSARSAAPTQTKQPPFMEAVGKIRPADAMSSHPYPGAQTGSDTCERYQRLAVSGWEH